MCCEAQSKEILLVKFSFKSSVGSDGIVGIVTVYGLHNLGIECWWGRDFLHLFRLTLFPGCGGGGLTLLGCGVTHPPKSSAKVKEKVEKYLYSHSVPSWPVLG